LTKKQYSPEMRMQIVKETMETGNASVVARRHEVVPSLVARWARCYKRKGTALLPAKRNAVAHALTTSLLMPAFSQARFKDFLQKESFYILTIYSNFLHFNITCALKQTEL